MFMSMGIIAGIVLYSAIYCLSLHYKPAWDGHKMVSWPHFTANYLPSIILLSLLFLFCSMKYFGQTPQAVAAILYVYALIVLSFVDLRTQILPDVITKPLIALGVFQAGMGWFCSWQESLLGAVLGYGIFWGVNTLFRALRKKEGMGYGDFKLLAAIGAWCGAGQLPLVILIASVTGIAVALLAALGARRPLAAAIPFGPALAFAGVVSLFWGERMVAAYLNLFIG